MRRDQLYLQDILEATEAVARFIAGFEADDFLKDEVHQSAVLQKFTIIGEAVANLSEDLRTRYPDVEWQKIKGLRNIIVHHYFSLDFETIWITAKRDVPLLQQQIQVILNEEFSD